MNRLDDMNSWRMFCEIVRAEGLNAACERLDCEPSTASRAIHALEKELGAPLFSRSSRPVKLTQLGHEAYQAALKLTATHEDMIRSLKGDKSKLSGLIRVTSHAGIGPAEITPALVEFQKIYPDISIFFFPSKTISTGIMLFLDQQAFLATQFLHPHHIPKLHQVQQHMRHPLHI